MENYLNFIQTVRTGVRQDLGPESLIMSLVISITVSIIRLALLVPRSSERLRVHSSILVPESGGGV